MSNLLIVIILLFILFPGTRAGDWKILPREVPWWMAVVFGFTVSLLGLFLWNDDRIILGGCFILLLTKWYSKHDESNWLVPDDSKSSKS